MGNLMIAGPKATAIGIRANTALFHNHIQSKNGRLSLDQCRFSRGKSNMADKDEISQWASLVPEIYFDLIARVLPGTLFVVALASILYGTDQMKNFVSSLSWAPAALTAALILGLGYAAGIMMLAPLGYSLFKS